MPALVFLLTFRRSSAMRSLRMAALLPPSRRA